MKITGDGFTVEVRELAAYSLSEDGWVVRYDTIAPGKPIGIFMQRPVHADALAGLSQDEIHDRVLTPLRAFAAVAFKEKLAAEGIDASECMAPTIPAWHINPSWMS